MDNCINLNCRWCKRKELYNGWDPSLAGSGVRLICVNPKLEKSKVIVNDLYEWLGYGGEIPKWCPGIERRLLTKLDNKQFLNELGFDVSKNK